jgi:XapX domain-containing protein
MKPYVIALGAGLLVGVIYGLLNVRSPAPPVIALVGLLGILLGEQVVPLAKHILGSRDIDSAPIHHQARHHVFGRLPCVNHPLPRTAENPMPGTPEKRA